MDFRHLLQSGDNNYLKCSICDNYLSYFPISISSNGEHVCGRCTPPDGQTLFNDRAYETLAKLLKFPCRYSSEGCFEEILPQKVKEHEANCPFRVVECIVEKPSKCEWKGSLSNLFQHCKNGHSQVILEDGEFEVGVDSTEEYDHLVEVESSFLIFRRKFDVRNRILEFSMFSNQYDSNTYTYDFELKAQKGRRSLLLDFQSGTYKEPVFDYFNLKYVTTESHREVKIKLSKKRTSGFDGLSQKYNSELLEVLKCYNCSNFLIPPIYQSMKDNYFCLDCKIGIDEDSSDVCFDETELFIQSVILDKFAFLVTYPCKNHKNGCLFKANYPEIKTHQSKCSFKKTKCPFSFFSDDVCNWEGLEKEIYQHVLEDSKKHYLEEMASDLELSARREYMQYGYIIHFCGKLFFLINEMDDLEYSWFLTKISPCNDRFRYEIDIIDETNEGRRLLVGKPCCNNFEKFVSNYGKRVGNEDYKCVMCYEQFSSVFKEGKGSNKVKYRLRIFKC